MSVEKYFKVQSIAKQVLRYLEIEISANSTEESIVTRAKELLSSYGVHDTWYHNVPAFVLLGSRSCLSISGRDYIPAQEKTGTTNLVTVDLSPSINNVWGDCARSFVIEKGKVVSNPETLLFKEGLEIETYLHNEMKRYVRPGTTFSELFAFGNQLIAGLGWQNLDFLNNLGHSIELSPEKRRFVDNECTEQLGAVSYFTFEPHICKKESHWGFKHENIYYFNDEAEIIEL